jgi:tetratricopeptide (TPR) repeat protein
MTQARGWPWGVVLFFAVIAAYSPVWWAGSIWDDEVVVTANPVIVGPLGLKEIWTTSAADVGPLTLTTFWLEHAVWGLDLRSYHIVNLLMHGACAVLLWRVLQSLRVPGAWLGAALWALHPVEVASVAWIAEMKNTESALFYLLAIFVFVKGLRAGNDRGNLYALSLIFAALALAAKSSTVVLPAVLCLAAWWVEGRWQWRNLARVAPVLLMAIVAAAVSIWTVDIEGHMVTRFDRSWPERLATAGEAVWFYLSKLIWPHPLMMIYPLGQVDAALWSAYLPLVAVLAALILLGLRRHSGSRPFFFAFAYFVACLLPVLGFVDNYIFRYAPVFDHFQYLASMGPLALTGAGVARWAESRPLSRMPSILGAGVVLLLGLLSWQRTWAFANERALWTDELEKNPDCWAAHNNLGWDDFKKGQIDEAIRQYQMALTIRPDYAEAHNDLGYALDGQGQVDAAIGEYERALGINPDYAEAHSNLASALMQKGNGAAALAEYEKALADSPHLAVTHYDLANALMQKGAMEEAIREYRAALAENPNLAVVHTNLAVALAQKGQLDAAIVEFQRALSLNPTSAQAYNNLGFALLQKGRPGDAIPEFQQALRLDPSFADAGRNLVRAQAAVQQAPGSK